MKIQLMKTVSEPVFIKHVVNLRRPDYKDRVLANLFNHIRAMPMLKVQKLPYGLF